MTEKIKREITNLKKNKPKMTSMTMKKMITREKMMRMKSSTKITKTFPMSQNQKNPRNLQKRRDDCL